ncbi:AarF/ABC1/UbiB kinase family protein [Sansalvadorimonas verongulae]|uniref:AarF/ABC1/UbiB kinase family protein n=1 Tax=Sansalvadorimonas verongulae TaxID=2172824 RepID=UPI0018AD2726|nr:AarF/ABC1/UbiB kinase family protein [Sansalvadorimonas verongulae]
MDSQRKLSADLTAHTFPAAPLSASQEITGKTSTGVGVSHGEPLVTLQPLPASETGERSHLASREVAHSSSYLVKRASESSDSEDDAPVAKRTSLALGRRFKVETLLKKGEPLYREFCAEEKKIKEELERANSGWFSSARMWGSAVKNTASGLYTAAKTASAAVYSAASHQIGGTEFSRYELQYLLETAGPLAQKVGQLLFMSGELSGEMMEGVKHLLEDNKEVAFSKMELTLKKQLGDNYQDKFSAFNQKPIGCGSIAQVYEATLSTGQKVAVKVIKPGIETELQACISALDLLLKTPLGTRTPGLNIFRNMLIDYIKSIPRECDLRTERRNMGYAQKALDTLDFGRDITIPGVYDKMSGKGVLVMEFIEGETVLKAMESNPHDALVAWVRATEAWALTIVACGYFHGDMHFSNVMVSPSGLPVLIDWGGAHLVPENLYPIRSITSQLVEQMQASTSGESFKEALERVLQVLSKCMSGKDEKEPDPVDVDRIISATVDSLLTEYQKEMDKEPLDGSAERELQDRIGQKAVIILQQEALKNDVKIMPSGVAFMRNVMTLCGGLEQMKNVAGYWPYKMAVEQFVSDETKAMLGKSRFQ